MIEYLLWPLAFLVVIIFGAAGVGFIGFSMMIIGTMLGYQQYPFWQFIIPASFVGMIAYYRIRIQLFLGELQMGVFNCLFWLILTLISQFVTWGIFFGLGTLIGNLFH